MIVYFYLNKKYLKLYGRSDLYFVDHLASLNRNGNAQKQIIGDFKITRRWVLIPVPNEGAVGGDIYLRTSLSTCPHPGPGQSR